MPIFDSPGGIATVAVMPDVYSTHVPSGPLGRLRAFPSRPAASSSSPCCLGGSLCPPASDGERQHRRCSRCSRAAGSCPISPGSLAASHLSLRVSLANCREATGTRRACPRECVAATRPRCRPCAALVRTVPELAPFRRLGRGPGALSAIDRRGWPGLDRAKRPASRASFTSFTFPRLTTFASSTIFRSIIWWHRLGPS